MGGSWGPRAHLPWPLPGSYMCLSFPPPSAHPFLPQPKEGLLGHSSAPTKTMSGRRVSQGQRITKDLPEPGLEPLLCALLTEGLGSL